MALIKIGHRGACGHAPENTLKSFSIALEMGVDMIEFDIHRSLSGEIVVCHDEDLKRTAKINKNIEQLPFISLRKINLGEGQSIPSIIEAIDFIDRRAKINIEIKCSGVARVIDNIIRYYVDEKGWKYSDFLVSSFKYRQMKTLHKLNSKIKLAAIIEDEIPKFFWTHAKELNVYSVHTSPNLIKKGLCEKAHKRGLKLFAYTINSPEDLNQIKDYGIDGFFTDYPDRF